MVANKKMQSTLASKQQLLVQQTPVGRKQSKPAFNRSSVITFVAISLVVALALIMAAVEAEHQEDHKHYKFNPYKYGYKVIDHKGNKQWKQEESHSPHEVKGSYGYKDKHGMFREVSYIADKHGFRAHVKTNEPGTAPKSSAGVKMDAHPEPSFHKSSGGNEASHGHR